MASTSSSEDKFYEKVIKLYLPKVMKQPQVIEMRERVLHIRDVQGPKNTGSMDARLEAVEQEIFKCQGMVEHGLNANHSMIMEFTDVHKVDGQCVKGIIFNFNEQINYLQSQIYDLQKSKF
ncbi:40S ribosomal protein S5-1 [Hordeum vulgare]|nr:40S ribosomal protein S5-1 [Hordeum vulgare]